MGSRGERRARPGGGGLRREVGAGLEARREVGSRGAAPGSWNRGEAEGGLKRARPRELGSRRGGRSDGITASEAP